MENIRKLVYCFILICFSVSLLNAQQIQVNLLIAKPSSYLSEWNNPMSGKLIIHYIPNGGAGQNETIRISGQLKDGGGNVLAGTSSENAAPLLLHSGANVFGLDEVLSLENLQTTAGFQQQLTHTGKLESGFYQLGVQVFKDSMNLLIPISTMQFKTFSISTYQLPNLVFPKNGSLLYSSIAEKQILFRWTPIVPSPARLANYKLTIVAIEEGQTTLQALQTNAPLLEKTIVGGTQFIWQPNLFFADSTEYKFVWTIQTTDENGNIFSTTGDNRYGLSTPSIFSVQPKKNSNVFTKELEEENKL